MKTAKRSKILLLIALFFFLFPILCSAEHRFEIEPRISVGHPYDDNIYLNGTDEKTDSLVIISPGISILISAINRSLSLDYSPTWVYYDEYDENNTVRHDGTLTFWQNIEEHLKFNLTNTYLKSEEPLEMTEEVEGVRSTRNTYQRNIALASLEYQFGPENILQCGYRHELLENEDVSIDDGTIRSPFAEITYMFDRRNGFELNYEFSDANFSRDDDTMPGDDYTGHSTGINYIYRFTPHIESSIGYHYTKRNFDGLTEDYAIHEGLAGLEYSLSPDTTLLLEGGFFVQKNTLSDDETGSLYNASLEKRSERWNIIIGAQGGWDEAYLEAERRGFSKYWSANSRLEYRFMENVTGYAYLSYRQDKDPAEREWKTFQGNCGLEWELLDRFFFSLYYLYAQRDDSVETEDYRVNRVMLTLTTSKVWKW